MGVSLKPVKVAPNTFTVRDGMIITTGIPTGVMRSERQYENFIVELDWMHMKKGGNSGFFNSGMNSSGGFHTGNNKSGFFT